MEKYECEFEKVIKDMLYSEEDGRYVLEFARNPENYPPLMFHPMLVVYYDKENKGYLILDEYKLLDFQDNLDKALDEYALKHRERFVPEFIFIEDEIEEI